MLKNLLRLRGSKPTVAGIIVKGSKILLSKRGKKIIIEGKKWCIPGGYIKFGEKAEDAVKREIKEEIGLDVKKSKFLLYHDEFVPRLGIHSLVLVFIIETSGKPKLNWEVSEIKWFNRKDVKKLDMAFTHREILERYFNKDK